jgi:hypothetical protein
MIIDNDIDFTKVKDDIKTEETIYNQIKDYSFDIPYVGIPLAYSINMLGISATQKRIDNIEKKYPGKKFYVCQHIKVKNLNFYDNIVFTPHTEISDQFHFIPHYNAISNFKNGIKKINERKIKFSFMGDLNSHPTRYMLASNKIDDCIVYSTGSWFFYKPDHEKKLLKEKYVDILNDTKISLCPRGSGPSTLRFFESMSFGSIPLIFNELKLPEELMGNVLKTNINDFIKNNLTIDDNKLQEMSDFIYDYYWENLSNDKLAKSIIKKIKNI